MYELEVPGRPVPKKRPRVTKNSTFTPRKTKQQEKKILQKWLEKYGRVELEGYLKLDCDFYFSDKRYGDWDNLGKLASDSLGGNVGWCPFNDKQIICASVNIHFCENKEQERTEIKVGRIGESRSDQ